MTDLLNDEEINNALTNLPEWDRSDTTLTRTCKLPGFPEAIQVVNRVAELAESMNHHPDIDIRWRTLTFALSTHSKGGITEADVSLAAQIDDAVAAM